VQVSCVAQMVDVERECYTRAEIPMLKIVCWMRPSLYKMEQRSRERRGFAHTLCIVDGSVADPNPYVFRPLGSGSISQRYGYGSGSFCHQAKLARKTLIPIAL
jgi:hypothetical protein